MAGSVLMLVASWRSTSRRPARCSFDLEPSYATRCRRAPDLAVPRRSALAFAIKVPMFPFHTWLPDAHVEAPTAGSVAPGRRAAEDGRLRLPARLRSRCFPHACRPFAPWIWRMLAVIGIVYGALVALVQPDMKKLVAYSSVSHLGFVMLGIASFTTFSVTGAVYQMLNHGIATGALFFLVGMLYDRRHTRLIAEFGGLKAVMPGMRPRSS